jgi:hypothetical protein
VRVRRYSFHLWLCLEVRIQFHKFPISRNRNVGLLTRGNRSCPIHCGYQRFRSTRHARDGRQHDVGEFLVGDWPSLRFRGMSTRSCFTWRALILSLTGCWCSRATLGAHALPRTRLLVRRPDRLHLVVRIGRYCSRHGSHSLSDLACDRVYDRVLPIQLQRWNL